MNFIKLKAYGKINLGLDVVRKREDGYHEVRMIMQTVNIFDRIEIKKTKSPDIKIKTNLYYLPTNEDNLVYKSAKLLMEEFDISQGIAIDLKKHIPVAAGMGGGSSDAAAVLYGVNRMFDLGLSIDDLMKRGVKLGADVPYCLLRGTVLAEGIGEKLTQLPPMPACSLIIAKPNMSLSTKAVYGKLNANELNSHPDIDGMVEAIRQNDLNGVAGRLENVLETITIPDYPIIGELKDFMMKHKALNALMSGSGPTVFGLYDDEKAARKAYEILKKKKIVKQLYITSLYNNRRQDK
ncbi:MAG: 4-(cytidine 5'-diphospho)-2-C-methyl-D-erythritol kinase [Clostridiales bacterium]|nr:4-(cytidine 5'-diphospho)-2-C-methyl-D-erythritol kinase [Clostridiales bacterium]